MQPEHPHATDVRIRAAHPVTSGVPLDSAHTKGDSAELPDDANHPVTSAGLLNSEDTVAADSNFRPTPTSGSAPLAQPNARDR